MSSSFPHLEAWAKKKAIHWRERLYPERSKPEDIPKRVYEEVFVKSLLSAKKRTTSAIASKRKAVLTSLARCKSNYSALSLFSTSTISTRGDGRGTSGFLSSRNKTVDFKHISASAGSLFTTSYNRFLDYFEDIGKEWSKLKDGNSRLSGWHLTKDEMELQLKSAKRRRLATDRDKFQDHKSHDFNRLTADQQARDSLKKPLHERSPLLRFKAKYGENLSNPMRDFQPASFERQQKHNFGLVLIALGMVGFAGVGSSWFARRSHQKMNDWKNEQRNLDVGEEGASWSIWNRFGFLSLFPSWSSKKASNRYKAVDDDGYELVT